MTGPHDHRSNKNKYFNLNIESIQMVGFKKSKLNMESERDGKIHDTESESKLADENASEKCKHTFRNLAVW